ncbi:MAG: acylneuraminate cytidylyltransferase family protein, partial [Candidatus Dadabacteria bacterium]|nr:acylneuraminate cytidylyltransferase family protein [Candidatus Dadabacteria bacterium]
QKLPQAYRLNGAIYLAKRDLLLETKTWYSEKTYAYIMPEEHSLDIDTPWDLYLANLILRDRDDDARD